MPEPMNFMVPQFLIDVKYDTNILNILVHYLQSKYILVIRRVQCSIIFNHESKNILPDQYFPLNLAMIHCI